MAYCEKFAHTDNDVVLTVFAGRNRPVATPFDGTPSAKGGNLNGIIGACRSLVLQLYNSLGQYIDLTFLRDGKLMAGMKQKDVSAFSQTIDCMLRSIGKSNCRCRITIIMDNILIYECTPRQFSGLNQLLDDLRSTVRQCREGEFGEYVTYKWICVHSFFNRMIRSPSSQHLLRMGPPKAAEAQGSKKNNRGNVGLWNPHQYGPRERSRVQGLPNLERGERLLRTLCNDPSHIVNDRIYCEWHSAQKDTPEREASKRVTCWSDEFQHFNWKSNGSLIIENTDPWGQMEPTSAHSWLLPYRNVEGLLENEIVLTFVPGLHNQKYDLLKGVSGLLRSITAQLLVRVKHAGELNYEDDDLLARVKSGHPDDLCDLFRTVVLVAQECTRREYLESCRITCIIDGMHYLEDKDDGDHFWKTFTMFRELVEQTDKECKYTDAGFKFVFLHKYVSQYANKASFPPNQRLDLAVVRLPPGAPGGPGSFATAPTSRNEIGPLQRTWSSILFPPRQSSMSPKSSRTPSPQQQRKRSGPAQSPQSTDKLADRDEGGVEQASAQGVARKAGRKSQQTETKKDREEIVHKKPDLEGTYATVVAEMAKGQSEWSGFNGAIGGLQRLESRSSGSKPGQEKPVAGRAYAKAPATADRKLPQLPEWRRHGDESGQERPAAAADIDERLSKVPEWRQKEPVVERGYAEAAPNVGGGQPKWAGLLKKTDDQPRQNEPDDPPGKKSPGGMMVFRRKKK